MQLDLERTVRRNRHSRWGYSLSPGLALGLPGLKATTTHQEHEVGFEMSNHTLTWAQQLQWPRSPTP